MVETTARDMVSRLGAIALVVLALACACGGSHAGGNPSDGGAVPADAIDDASPDAPPDAGPPAPRLVAPLSTTTVTQRQPVLHWDMPDGVAAPVVELCKDRSCRTPLAITIEVASNGRSAAPHAALPPGWVYWRVRAMSGGQMVSSATWQFWVGRSSASNPVDTGNGAILDINGDGYADILVGAPQTFSDSGVAYLYLGSATPRAADWNSQDPSARFLLRGGASNGHFGAAVASAGDVNGDGYADFLIGAPGAAPGGEVHLYLGSANPSAVDWNGPNASRRIDLSDPVAQGGGFGVSVASAGDIDGDGYADFIVGGGPGAHVYFGSATPGASQWSGASTRRIDLANPGTDAGWGSTVAGAGDVNGDGHADLLVGGIASFSDARTAYLYLGSAAPSATSWNAASTTARIELTTPDDFYRGFGATLAGAGDVNGDGYADFVIAATGADGGDPTTQTGAAHVYFGSSLPTAAAWNGSSATQRADLVSPDGTPGAFGSAIAGAGDVNGDGFSDFIVGNVLTGEGRGAAHVYLGGATVDLPGWNGAVAHAARIDLFSPDGVNALFGRAAGNAGDVNGDGLSDFLIGTVPGEYAPSPSEGAAHLYLGMAVADASSWSGVAPAMRIDLASPDGEDTGFGGALAVAPPRSPASGPRFNEHSGCAIRTPSDRSSAACRRCSRTPSHRRG